MTGRADGPSPAARLLSAWAGGPSRRRVEAEFPPLGRMVTVEGVRVHLVEMGAGPAVALIHGASGNLRDFTFSLAPRLARRFRVIAFDRPGHGYSERPATAGESPVAQARILAAAARAVGVRRALIAGHSFGAAPAVAWALEAPDMAAGLLLVSGATHPWGGALSPLYRLGVGPAGWAVRALVARRLAALVDEVFAPNAPPAGYAAHLGAALALRPDTFHWNARDILGLNDHLAALAPRYPRLAQPVEIVHGAADAIIDPADGPARMAAEAPRAMLRILDGVGHMPHHAAEDEIVAALDRLAARAEV